MIVETINDNIQLKDGHRVKLSKQGNITEVMYQSSVNKKCYVKKLNKNQYIDLKTGEVKDFIHGTSRASDLNNVRASLRRLRELINTNVTNNNHCKWITLTYAENMTDQKRLYKDFEKFTKRLKYHIKDTFEYIVAMEPQGRGAWHCHLILIFNNNAPYIANKQLAEIWGLGFVSVKAMKEMDNLGAYLTAYLGDMETNGIIQDRDIIKTVEVEKNGKKESKAVVKGGRLPLYPQGFNIYRCSKGIKKPTIIEILEIDLKNHVKNCVLTFKKAIKIFDVDTQFEKIIFYRYYKKIKGGESYKCNLRQRKNGSYEARCRVDNRQISRYGRTEHEAKYKLKCYLDDIGIELEEDNNVRTLGAWLIEWFDVYKKPNLSINTIKSMEITIRVRISEKLKSKPLFLITALDIQKALNEVEKSRSRKFAYDTLRGALTKAHILGYTRNNIISAVEPVRHKYKKGEALTQEEQELFLQAVQGNDLKELFLFYLYSGCRRNEALDLKWNDIDYKKEVITIRGTKTDTSIRVIPLIEGVKKALEAQKEKQLDNIRVFPYKQDKPTKTFKSFCNNHKLHDLRHTFATRCVECGISLKVVQKWLGHSSIETTSSIYTHILDKFSQEEAKKYHL